MGFRSAKDHLSSNTAGDCRLKLLIVHHSAAPHTVCVYRKIYLLCDVGTGEHG
jgi:hypothetical protein